MPSEVYNRCSRVNMCMLKCCWSFSLAKLMQSCSNEFLRAQSHIVTKAEQPLGNILKDNGLLYADGTPVKHFKTINVQQANLTDVFLRSFVADAFVDAPDKPVEQASVDHLRHRMPSKRS